jgi:hypothetical protein
MPRLTVQFGELYVGNSYCIVVTSLCRLVAVKLATGELVAEWMISQFCQPIVAHSKNDLLAIITESPVSVRFLKIVIPE